MFLGRPLNHVVCKKLIFHIKMKSNRMKIYHVDTMNWSNSFKEKDSEEVIKDSEEHNKIKGSTL